MPVPKKRLSTTRRNRRRANHDKVARPHLSSCPRCLAFKMPHRVCGTCGYYKDREVIQVPDLEQV